MVGQGCTSKGIAERLGVSPKTIEVHRANLMKKLDVTNVAGLTRWAVVAEQMSSDSE
jgi:two-component system NarL family response regulator